MTGEKVIDLDAIAGEVVEHTIKIGGKPFKIPGDLGVEQMLALRKASGSEIDFDEHPEESIALLRSFFAMVFGEEHVTEVLRLCGMRKLGLLMEAIVKIYGLDDPGKAPGSSRASRRAGARSKPTSGRSTASGSSTRASATKRSGSAARKSRG